MSFKPLAPPAITQDGRTFRHREVAYPPAYLRTLRLNVYVPTDHPDWVPPAFAAETDGVVTSLEQFSDLDLADSAFYVYFSLHDLALPFLGRLVACGGLFAQPPTFQKTPYEFINKHVLDSYNQTEEVLCDTLFMGIEVHAQICQAIKLTKDLPDDYVEIGVFSGSSALTALHHLSKRGLQRRSWLFETYSGFTYPAAATSSDLVWSGPHLMAPEKTVKRIASLTADTGQDVNVVPLEICGMDLPDEITSIAVTNVDVGLYDAVVAALRKIAPRMVQRRDHRRRFQLCPRPVRRLSHPHSVSRKLLGTKVRRGPHDNPAFAHQNGSLIFPDSLEGGGDFRHV